MNEPSTITDYVIQKDSEHIRVLAIFHFVVGCLCLVGMGFIFLHYFMMHNIFMNPEMWKGKEGPGPPKEFFQAFIGFYIFMGAMLASATVGNVLSGVFLLKKRSRMFSMVVGGLDCLMMPFGTVLGVFTIVVLSRDSVRSLYDAKCPNGNLP